MPKTFTAPFAQTPKTGFAVVTAANATLTNNGSTEPDDTVLLLTAGSNGAIVTRIYATGRVTTTANALYLYLSKDTGTNKYLIYQLQMTVGTVSATAAIGPSFFTAITETTPMRLEAGDQIYAANGTAFASGVVFMAEFTDF